MKNTMKKNKSNFDIIIREKATIKSRQWWSSRAKRVRNSIINNTGKKIQKLAKQNTISILVTNNSEIKKLNKTYRNKNKATDVLSFQSSDISIKAEHFLGDIVISTAKAKEQAKKRSVNVEEELTLLLIHGYLHLLGYDHETKADEKKMFSIQNKVLNELNCQEYNI